jgi:hypothetical protein
MAIAILCRMCASAPAADRKGILLVIEDAIDLLKLDRAKELRGVVQIKGRSGP